MRRGHEEVQAKGCHEEIDEHGAQHEQLSVGHVHDLQDAVYEREAVAKRA